MALEAFRINQKVSSPLSVKGRYLWIQQTPESGKSEIDAV